MYIPVPTDINYKTDLLTFKVTKKIPHNSNKYLLVLPRYWYVDV